MQTYTPVLYTSIDTESAGMTAPQVHSIAQRLGYVLIPFNGWDNADLGPSGNPGPRWAEARENGRRLLEISDACTVRLEDGTEAYVHIRQTVGV